MSVPIIAFFNNKGGVGKTSLVYHLSWMFADLGKRVVAADFDPQANLTAAFLEEDRLEELWNNSENRTVYGCIQPLLKGTGDIAEPHLEKPEDNLALLVGDLSLSGFEDELSSQWPACLDRKERAFRVISAFWRIIQKAVKIHNADLVLIDLGPNLGAINRAALIASDYIIIPLSPDLFSLQGLKNLGPTVRVWRKEWKERLSKKPPSPELELPEGKMLPVGYLVLQHTERLDRPVKAYDKWLARIPQVFHRVVLDESVSTSLKVANDLQCLSLIKHYRSLMPLAQEARKPIFHLKPADGAIGSHLQAVGNVYQNFKNLALKLDGIIEQKADNWEKASRSYRQSLAIDQALQDKSGAAKSLNRLGVIEGKRGNLEQALQYFQQSLEIYKELGDKSGIASSLNNLGITEQEQGNSKEADQYYRQSLEIFKELGDKSGIATSLHQLGRLEEKRGNLTEALKHYLTAHSIFKAAGMKSEIEIAKKSLARLEKELGKEKFEKLVKEGAESREQGAGF